MPFSARADFPAVHEVKTEKGYNPWFIEDHYLPIISIKIAFSGSGNAYDPKDKLGLANMTTALLGEGAGNMSDFAYKKRLEEIATDISFSTDEDNFYISLKTLKPNLEESLKLLNLVITQPNFKDDSVARIKKQLQISLKKSEEDPEYVAGKKFKETIFAGHPYSNPQDGTIEGIEKINRQDLLAFVKNNFTKENAVISIVGDLKEKEIVESLDKFITLPDKRTEHKEIPEFVFPTGGKLVSIEKSLPQTVVIFGMQGIKRSDKDFYPAYLMNHILGGGGFESRLMDSVREKNGLAYTVYSSLDTMKHAGLFSGYVATDSSKVKKSIELVKQEINKMGKNGATQKELDDARDYLIGSFPLKMTKNENLSAFLTVMQLENLGKDFIEKRNSYMKAVTLEQIKNISAKLLNTDKMIMVVVGNKVE